MKRVLSTVAFLLVFAAPAFAATRQWTGAIDNLWATAGNWNPAGTPASGDHLQFPNGGPLTPTINNLGAAVILGSVSLGDAHSVSGDTVRVTGGATGTFDTTVEIEGDALAGGDFATLDINDNDVHWNSGTIATLAGSGTLNAAQYALTLSGSHPFSGEVVDGNTFIGQQVTLDNASAPAATFRIGRGIKGEGTIGPMIANGWVDPRSAGVVGTITTGDLSLTSIFAVPEEVGEYYVDITSTGNDALVVQGSVTLQNKPLTITLASGFVPPPGSSYTIVDNDGADAVSGVFTRRSNPFSWPGTTLSEGTAFTIDGHEFRITYQGGTGNDIVLTTPEAPIPPLLPALSIENVASEEGNPGSGRTVDVTVTLNEVSGSTVIVEYRTEDGSAIAGTDYVPAAGALQFAPGETQKTVSVTLVGDNDLESDEIFYVTLFNASAATIQRADSIVTIRNDDQSFGLIRGLTYSSHGTQLDLRLPRPSASATPPTPVIVAIEADDWSAMSARVDFADRQASRGFAVATITVRSPFSAPFPAQLDDVRAAIAWVRDHANVYNLDPRSIALWGCGLAGGHLAALAGTTGDLGDRVQGVVVAQAATDLGTLLQQSCVGPSRLFALLGCDPAACPATAQAASPVAHASQGDPPFLILHGSGDCNAPRAQSDALASALLAANVPATRIDVPFTAGAIEWTNPQVQQALDEFLDRTLRAKGKRQRAVRK